MKEIKIKNKRYIRGMINSQIADAIRSRKATRVGEQETTDPAIRSAVLKKTGGVCYICNRRYGTKEEADRSPSTHFSELQVDHIVAFSRGGPNRLGNYMPICARCNNLKSDGSVGDAKLRLAKKRAKQ